MNQSPNTHDEDKRLTPETSNLINSVLQKSDSAKSFTTTQNAGDQSLHFDDFVELIDALNHASLMSTSGEEIRELRKVKIEILRLAIADTATFADRRRALSDLLQSRPNRDIPWREVVPKAKGIAFLYNFSPFQDTGATVASKRIRNFAQTFDVVSCSFLHRKKQDLTIECIADPYIASKYFLPVAPSWASWEPFKTFAIRASNFAQRKVESGAQYETLYSRAMWAPSMFAAMLFKKRNPSIQWVAEFSDPMSLDVEGLPRGGKVPDDELTREFISDLETKYPELVGTQYSVFSLAEYLVYAFADQIMFTNSNQKSEMLDRISSSDLRRHVESKAVVSNHPTLPREYYLREASKYEVEDSKLNLGYFGEFYSSRSITEVTAAIRTLPDRLRERVHLHVFTNFIPSGPGNQRPRNMSRRQYEDYVKRAYDGVGAEGIEEHVSFNASLPFLKFLATTEKLDYLIVNDAKTGSHHNVNPFLPSKWSDYAGSSAKSWGFVEPNSILSQKPVTVKTSVGDALGARAQLWDMVLEKFPDLKKEF